MILLSHGSFALQNTKINNNKMTKKVIQIQIINFKKLKTILILF